MRPNYTKAIMWVASNDEPTLIEVEEVKDQISVLLIGDLFDVPNEKVAKDIIKIRLKEKENEREN